MIISYINSVFDETIALTTSSEDPTRPLNNLRDKHKCLKFRTTDVNGQYISLFKNEGMPANYIGILSHNVQDSVSILIQGDNVNNFVTPAFSVEVNKSGLNDIAYRFNDTPLTYRYWRITFSTGQVGDRYYDAASWSGQRKTISFQNVSKGTSYLDGTYGNTDSYGRGLSAVITTINRGTKNLSSWGNTSSYYTPNVKSTDDNFIEIGVLWLGEAVSVPSIKQDMTITYNAETRQSITVNGSVDGSPIYEYRTTEISLPILSLAKEDKKKLTSFFRYVYNYGYFLTQIWDNDIEEEQPIYAIFNDEKISFKKEKSLTYPFSTTLPIREVF